MANQAVLAAAKEAYNELSGDSAETKETVVTEKPESKPSIDEKEPSPKKVAAKNSPEPKGKEAGTEATSGKPEAGDAPSSGSEAKPSDDLPQNLPAEWRELISQNPAAKDIVLKQFANGNKLIYNKANELNRAHGQVQEYLGLLTKGIEPVIAERYKGDRNIFAADVNRLIGGLFSPHKFKRYEAVKEIVESVLPDGFSETDMPDQHTRFMLEQVGRLTASQQPPAPQKPAAQEPKNHTEHFQREIDTLSRYNADAKKFIDDLDNAKLIVEKYRQISSANPNNDLGANVVEAVFEAMKEQAESSAKAAQEAKRQAASRLSIVGSQEAKADGTGRVKTARQAAAEAWAELNHQRV